LLACADGSDRDVSDILKVVGVSGDD